MRYNYLHIALFVVLAASACTKESAPEGERCPVACVATAGALTKGAGATTSASLQTDGIGLFAWETAAGTSFDGTASYIENVEFAYDGSSATWRGGVYWPFGSWLSFFSYAPYVADVSAGALQFPSSDYVSGYPRLQYTPDSDVASQVDLCLSTPVMDRSYAVNDGVVPLVFSHVLSKVCIRACWTGNPSQMAAFVADGKTVKLHSVTISGVAGTNKLTYGASSFLWDTPSVFGASYAMSTSSEFSLVALPTDGSFSSAFWDLSDPCLYVLPQSLTGSAEMEVEFGLYNGSGVLENQVTDTFNLGSLPMHVWPAGVEVLYSLSLDITGHCVVNVDLTFDANAGRFLTPEEILQYTSGAGTFLGGDFLPASSQAGTFGRGGSVVGGSTAGSFIN
jgi:hypothetical protein